MIAVLIAIDDSILTSKDDTLFKPIAAEGHSSKCSIGQVTGEHELRNGKRKLAR